MDTKLLLNFEGSDAATATFDDSSSGHHVSFFGTAQLDTAQSQFGSSSLLLDGNSDYLTFTDSDDWDVVASTDDDWTIDMFVRFNSITGAQRFMTHVADSSNFWQFSKSSGHSIFFSVVLSSTTELTLSSGTSDFVANTWYHVAMCKVGDEYGLYVDGSQLAYTQDSTTADLTGTLYLGLDGAATTRYFNGWMDAVRVSHANIFGAAPNSTPDDSITVPTSAPSLHDTKLILKFNNVDGSTQFEDNSGNAHVVTANNDAVMDDDHVKFGTHSCKFDGTGDYLTVPDSADWDIAGSALDDWTISFWAYHNVVNTSQTYMSQYENTNNRWLLFKDSAGYSHFDVRSGGTVIVPGLTGTQALVANQWNHVAMIKLADKYSVYINGVQSNYIISSSTDTFSSPLYIGTHGAIGSYMDGNIDDLQIANSDVYGIDMHGSAGFNGSTSNMTAPDSADWDIFSSDTGDWTIDFWVYHITNSGEQTYIAQYEDASNHWEIRSSWNGTDYIYAIMRSGGTDEINIAATTTISDTGAWHHIAFCKVDDEYGLYLDGTQIGYQQTSSTDTFAGTLRLGMRNSDNYFYGYMDEVRIIQSNPFSAAPNSTPDDTITVPTAPYTSDANTKLLLHMEPPDTDSGNTGHTITDTNITNRVGYYSETLTLPTAPHTTDSNASLSLNFDSYDKSESRHPISKFAGTAAIDDSQKKFGNASFFADGNSDYMEIPYSGDFQIIRDNTSDWTLDFWIRMTDHAGNENVVSFIEDANTLWYLRHANGSGWFFYASNAGGTTLVNTGAGGEITDTNWHHIALCKVGDEYAVYVDGDQENYTQDTSTYMYAESSWLNIMASRFNGSTSEYTDGHIDNIRITRSNLFGAAPNVGETDTITVPTADIGEKLFSQGVLV